MFCALLGQNIRWAFTGPLVVWSSFAGVSQGENLPPVLFSIYLNDLENFLL